MLPANTIADLEPINRNRPRGRNSTEQEKYLSEMADLYLKGRTQNEIAAHFGVSQPQISTDLKKVRKRWREMTNDVFDAKVSRELAKVDAVEREFWQAWLSSKTEWKRTSKKRTTDPGGRKHREVGVLREQREGNPAFLEGVLRCITQRCRILGLEAPIKQEVAGKGGLPVQFTISLAERPEYPVADEHIQIPAKNFG